MRRHLLTTTAGLLLAMTASAYAGMDEAKTFLDKEIGDLSTLSRADQEKEMQWFVDAAKPFAGMDIKVVSETHDNRMNMNRRCWHPPSPQSPASRSPMTSSAKATWSKSCRRRCSRAKTSTTPISTTRDLIGTHWRYQQARSADRLDGQ